MSHKRISTLSQILLVKNYLPGSWKLYKAWMEELRPFSFQAQILTEHLLYAKHCEQL